MTHISRVLQQFPQIELDALSWRVERPTERREAKRAKRPGAGKVPPAIQQFGFDLSAAGFAAGYSMGYDAATRTKSAADTTAFLQRHLRL